jgi:hypothetical protein
MYCSVSAPAIRAALSFLGRTQEWLAGQIGVTKQYLSVFLTAAPKRPTPGRVRRLKQIRARLEAEGIAFTTSGGVEPRGRPS